MKIPKPRKLKSGNWHCQMRLGGEEVYVTESTKDACIAKAKRIKAEYLAGKRLALSREVKDLTLREAVDRFLKARGPVLSPSTLRSYQSYKKHRFPQYQEKRLKDIDFQAMINAEMADMSAKTTKNAWALVRAALDYVGYPVPRVQLAKVPERDLAFLQPEEILPFCEAVRGRPYEIAALLLLHGLRLSEVLGLTWDNVDLKRGVVRVSGAVVRGPDGMVEKRTNKNRTSARIVPIMIPQLSEALEGVSERSGAVVGIHPSNLLDDVKRACMRAGTTICTCHDLRRSFLSLGYHLGISERQLMLWGGYSDIQTMHRVYIKIAASDMTEDRKRMTEFFRGSRQGESQDENQDGVEAGQ